MNTRAKNLLLITGSILAIVASALWIYFGQFNAPKHNVQLHERVGEVMAEQTARLLGGKGRILLLTMGTSGEPELETQLTAFRRRLKQLGQFEIKEHELDTKDKPKYGPGSGLSARRFVRSINNNPTVDAIVSFVGAPELSDQELAEIKKVPKFIAESRSPDHLPQLFQKQILTLAVVSRFTFPAPGPLQPKTPQEWFDKRYQVVAAENLATLPKAE